MPRSEQALFVALLCSGLGVMLLAWIAVRMAEITARWQAASIRKGRR